MSAKHLVLILVLAAGAVTAVFAMRHPAPEEALPAAEGEIPRIVIVAKRERAADQRN
jgi:Flp pilus assembly protein CpaB